MHEVPGLLLFLSPPPTPRAVLWGGAVGGRGGNYENNLAFHSSGGTGPGEGDKRVRRPNPGGHDWTVMADPEGNEFCAFILDEAG